MSLTAPRFPSVPTSRANARGPPRRTRFKMTDHRVDGLSLSWKDLALESTGDELDRLALLDGGV